MSEDPGSSGPFGAEVALRTSQGGGLPVAGGGDCSLLHLMQLSSSLCPIGAFAYSQGLEQAVERGWLNEVSSVEQWLGSVGAHCLVNLDLPILRRCVVCWQRSQGERALSWSERLLCSRESCELRAQELHLGRAFGRLLASLEVADAQRLLASDARSYVAAYALGAAHFGVTPRQASLGYCFAWVEQQINAVQRLLPLGHTAGQGILTRLLNQVPHWVDSAEQVQDGDIGAATAGLAMASAWHEQQYSRLFRS